MIRTLAAAMAVLAATAAPALAEGDAEEGEKVFRKCKACHTLEEGSHRVGPSLYNVVGSEIAHAEGYSYSDAFMAKQEEGYTWTEENLDAYLEDPRETIPGTKMTFAGLRDEQDRADVIAYLKQASE